MLRALIGFGLLLGVQCAAPSIAVSAELDEIQARGYLVVAVKDNWRPLGFRDDQGNLVGLEIDIARQLALEIFGDPNAVRLEPVSNLERLSTVLAGEVDIAIAGLSITPARTRIVSFSDPYYLDGTTVITRQPNLRSLNDLNFMRLAVLSQSDAIATTRYLIPTATLVSVDSYQAAWELLEQGDASAFIGDATVLAGWVQDHPNYHVIPSLMSAEPLAIALPKGVQYDDLRELINTSITQWHETGWLEERATYWGLP